MIKRLKWNVLYGDDINQSSDLSDASDSSAQIGTDEAKATLERLARNDPELSVLSSFHPEDHKELKEETDETSSSTYSAQDDTELDYYVTDKEKALADIQSHFVEDTGDDNDKQGTTDENDANWRECTLCPGKRFLNDDDVRSHIESKRHKAALARLNNPMKIKKIRTVDESDRKSQLKHKKSAQIVGASQEDSNVINDASANLNETPLSDKKKQKAKRKLQLLKRRKWEQNGIKGNKQAKDAPPSLTKPGKNSEAQERMAQKGKAENTKRKSPLNERKTTRTRSSKKRNRSDSTSVDKDESNDEHKANKIRKPKKSRKAMQDNGQATAESNFVQLKKDKRESLILSRQTV